MDTDRTELDTQLQALNAAVDEAIAQRTAWMDRHMPDYAVVNAGEDLYDLYTGVRLGKVTRLYRFWADRDFRYDREMSVEYEFETGPRSRGNTSSMRSVKPGRKTDIRKDLIVAIAQTRAMWGGD